MYFFDKRLSICILLLSLPLLFLPKINLLSVNNAETAGLRIDDLILLGFGLLLFFSQLLLKPKMFKIEGLVLGLTLFSVISFLSNRLLVFTDFLQWDAKIFYVFRFLEYFMFFYIGAIAAQLNIGKQIIVTFCLANFLLMFLQKLGIAGAITVEGFQSNVSSRVQGVASFPSEMGLLLNLLFCFIVFDPSIGSSFVDRFSLSTTKQFLRRSYLYFMFVTFGLFVVFTGNRISIVALIVTFLIALKEKIHIRSIGSFLSIFVLLPLLFFGIGMIITQTASVYQRSSDLFSMKNIDLFGVVWDKIDLTKNPLESEGVIQSGNYDMSWWLRIHKWIFITKTYFTHPENYLQGLGPGVAGAALDGGILRILTEYGLIGSGLFFAFFQSIARINSQLKWMTLAFMINMIFFDAYLAYKTMSLFFFAAGVCFQESRVSDYARTT